MRIGWKSNLHGVARCPPEYKLLGEGEPAARLKRTSRSSTLRTAVTSSGGSDITEPGAFTLQEKGLPPIRPRGLQRRGPPVAEPGSSCSDELGIESVVEPPPRVHQLLDLPG